MVRPDFHEKNHPGASPGHLVREHALGKALSAAKKVKNGTILAADSIVYCGGKVIGKPRSLAEARRFLNFLQGRWQTVYSGVALLKVRGGKVKKKTVFMEKTRIFLEKMSREQVDAYFRKVNPLDKAGGFALQAGKYSCPTRIKGSYYNAVGLPIERLLSIIK